MKRLLAWLLACGVVVAGCSRANVTTKLSADGSFVRTIQYTVNSTSGPPDPATLFDIPKESPGVQVEKTKGSDTGEVHVTITMPVAPGSRPPHAVGIRGTDGKIDFSSDLTVSKQPNGNLVYTETIHSLKASASDLSEMTNQIRPEIKKDLPARLAETEKIDAITSQIGPAFIRAFLGPPSPCIAEMAADPDAASHVLARVLYGQVLSVLKGQGLTDEEARKMTQKLFKSAEDQVSTQSAPHTSSSTSPGADPVSMTLMTFNVQVPGKIISTDGLVDPLTNEIYWTLYPAAAEMGDVKLNLIVDPNGVP